MMSAGATKVRNQDANPCIDESDASQKCLDRNSYDKAMCSAFFQRYKACRKYWVSGEGNGAPCLYLAKVCVCVCVCVCKGTRTVKCHHGITLQVSVTVLKKPN
ncbi:coiled-coil-helix-coiled-coil-helix domain-containing protein 7 isoform X1 [Denticeps clupeoides]|uniref:coiled-coil-helix-coiled-coil-helix domain-containing protein 7 isoform X1 n=1 Tax=Denticeps clupeoides TaxID=299321 RepID=UPI0010A48369|nr:coiled-coil-helix-coiled-coil-helix domain-containing protein 7 isoform X1 [Denticeps clupeoides]XP_028824840.1 coiled-coil-helix-coiled-coil-helix domain-containing protein 7 isoform X1 [Denticeps clupeoides]XP_028824847.1 coiled-coil-helix-coiled-coil-helix domain-containing protein 7 isoform X1 [Denticeps clupeoides]XP_028824855.1 coiled-coil-helix-coiled-coil-helix domain-containing protein 7 isoform X1 [Denticeps clupeoides]XP_028824862.1 coiled-coil-helix-coiled-coil-helix domain-conta